MRARPGSPAARLLAAVVASATALAALAGCVAIPTSGEVQRGGEGVVAEPRPPIPQANAPEVGATPTAIVNGFLTAGAAGLADEYTVARQFLTPRASAEWLPRAQVLIHGEGGGGLDFQERSDGTVLVTVPVQGKIDSSFVYTEVAPGAREELVFELTRDADDEWRIAAVPDGVVMSRSNFDILYRRLPVYFVSQDRTHLIPDLRWFPNENTPTYAVTALLAGPSPWLRDGVQSGVPDGAELNALTVPVSTDLQATVDLSPDANVTGAADSINLLQAQLEAMLQRLPGVKSVVVQRGSRPWVPDDVPVLLRDVSPQTGPYVLVEDRLAVIDGGSAVTLPDAAPLVGLDANSPAVGPADEMLRVVLAGSDRLMHLPPDGSAPVPLATGSSFVPPSIDRFGWVWTGERSSAGTLLAVDPSTGESSSVTADLLLDRNLVSLRVARDGARIALVHVSPTDPDDVVVDVAAIARDETGRPQILGEDALQVGAVLDSATEVAWADEVTLAVLGTSGAVSVPSVHLVPLGGPTRRLSGIDRTTGIAARRGGDRGIYLADLDGTLLSIRGSSWVVVAVGVKDPVFPG